MQQASKWCSYVCQLDVRTATSLFLHCFAVQMVVACAAVHLYMPIALLQLALRGCGHAMLALAPAQKMLTSATCASSSMLAGSSELAEGTCSSKEGKCVASHAGVQLLLCMLLC
jgi:hypothetical protein